ncbi:MAG: chloride channel protein [Leptolyngbyaceae cyanobacterium bins.302]|nr:chloride channel protein [Leptolyngbyaceae cyanobacterium bins.302]
MLFTFSFNLVDQLLKPKRLAILEAVLIGLVAAFAAVLLKQGVQWLSDWRIKTSLITPAWLLLPCVGFGGGFLAGLLLEQLAPEATGSGVPQVKATLAYVPIELDLRVAVVKLLSSMLTLGSGFVLGRQGPTVQIGAALAAQMSRWVPSSPDHQRQLIAAGAAAGLAAGFDAPIAGVLFVIEELLHDVSSLTLGTAILASFTGGIVSRIIAGPNLSLAIDSSIRSASFSPQEIPFFLVLGILAGIFAALFNRSILTSLRLSRQHLRIGLPLKIGLAGFISGGVIALLPLVFRDTTTLQGFLTTETMNWQITIGAFLVQFLLSVLACSAEAPGGLFIPSLVLGAALGKLVGLIALTVFPTEPIVYALAGMGAFFGAVAKVPITAIVIVFEITINYNLILPLMICAVTAYLVAERLAPGSLYTHLLELKGIFLEPDAINDGLWAKLSAAEVMQTKVETLDSGMTVEEVVRAFSNSHHRGFPVMAQGRLVGIVTQTDLDKVTQRQLPLTALLADIMTPKPITVAPNDTLGRVLYLLSRNRLSRLPVVEHRKLVGIITRSDILQVESDKLRGDDDRIGPQPEPSYLVYQTRSPATGQGRLLLPLSNPQTANALLKLALVIAREFKYEMECLRIVPVARHHSPAETPINTTLSRRLLKRAVQQGASWHIPVHTQIRAAQNIAGAMLETVKERHIDLLLMGWKGSTSTPGRIFGDTVDTAIRQATCDVVLVKMGDNFGFISTATDETAETSVQAALHLRKLNRWLVPMGGGPNAEYAVKLLPALVSLSPNPSIRLCHVYHPSEPRYDAATLEVDAAYLRHRCRGTVEVTSVCAASVIAAVVDMAQKDQCDVIVLGASREGLLQQAIHGNIPEAIARESKCTVILVRKAIA